MSVNASSANVFANSIPTSSPVTSQGNDVPVAQGSARWQDKDGNGKVDIEVDFGDEEGEHFSSSGMTGFNAPNEAQQRQLRFQMGLMSNDVNVTFHKKGEIDNPDAKIKIGSFQHIAEEDEDVVVDVVTHTPSDPSKPVEVYFNGNEAERPTISAPDGFNEGGSTLTRVLLSAMGVNAPKPVGEGGKRDSHGYSVLSTESETTTGQDFKGQTVTGAQIDDKKQLEDRFGANTSVISKTFEVDKLGDEGYGATFAISSGVNGHETIDASADTHDQDINLKPGAFSSVKGYKGNVSITMGTVVEDVKTGSGTNRITPNAGSNTITLGAGKNTVAYEHWWDGDPNRPDKVVGFKSGTDKIDVSAFYSREKLVDAENPRLILDRKENGETWLMGWTNFRDENNDRPEFSLRVDGARSQDIITGPDIVAINGGGIPNVIERSSWFSEMPRGTF